ncbi:MAG TPA: hypothetical protein VFZ40_17635 [Pyrinomonadaceae bacterium]
MSMRLRISTSVAVTCFLVLACISVTPAQQQAAPTKFDSYADLPTDDEAARLDAFAEALRNQSHLRGYLIGYNQTNVAPGVFLRRLYGDQRYLVEMRGLASSRVVVIEGGYRERLTIELWLVPNDSTPPTPNPTSSPPANSGKRRLFDEECLECSPAVNLDLYGLSDGLKFYAEALRKNPRARGLIVVRPGQEIGARGTLAEARKAKRLLIREHRIDARRITINVARRRRDNVATAEMWILN